MTLLKGNNSPLVSMLKSRLSSKVAGAELDSNVKISNSLLVLDLGKDKYGLTGFLIFLGSSDLLKFILSESSDSVTPVSFWPPFQLDSEASSLSTEISSSSTVSSSLSSSSLVTRFSRSS